MASDDDLESSERFINNDLQLLGIPSGTKHKKIEFDNELTTKFMFWQCYWSMIICPCFIPVCCPCSPCVWYANKASAESRKAVITEQRVSLHYGYYGCICCPCGECCWNESTKTVPLNQVTDVSWTKSWLQSIFNIDSLSIRTASSKVGNEVTLLGANDSKHLRKVLLKMRDDYLYDHSKPIKNDNNDNNDNDETETVGLLQSTVQSMNAQLQNQVISSQITNDDNTETKQDHQDDEEEENKHHDEHREEGTTQKGKKISYLETQQNKLSALNAVRDAVREFKNEVELRNLQEE